MDALVRTRRASRIDRGCRGADFSYSKMVLTKWSRWSSSSSTPDASVLVLSKARGLRKVVSSRPLLFPLVRDAIIVIAFLNSRIRDFLYLGPDWNLDLERKLSEKVFKLSPATYIDRAIGSDTGISLIQQRTVNVGFESHPMNEKTPKITEMNRHLMMNEAISRKRASVQNHSRK